MSKKCPHCGSTDTRLSVGGCTEEVINQSFRIVATAAAGLVGEIFHPAAGHRAAEKTLEALKSDSKTHVCNHCGWRFRDVGYF